MLSSKYRITYWAIASVAVAAHHVFSSIIGAAAETFFHTIAFPLRAAALYIIWCGAREKPVSLLQTAVHQTLVACSLFHYDLLRDICLAKTYQN